MIPFCMLRTPHSVSWEFLWSTSNRVWADAGPPFLAFDNSGYRDPALIDKIGCMNLKRLLFILLTAVILATGQTNSSPKSGAAKTGSTASAKKGALIDIDSATAEELDSLPAFGPKTRADQSIRYIEVNGVE
jgi:hypothetical protein